MNFVHNKPIVVADPKVVAMLRADVQKNLIGDVNKSIIADKDSKRKLNELYVDIFERLNVTLSVEGSVLSQSIDGSLTMRSYLNGCPPVRMLLSQNLLVGKDTPIPVMQDETGRTLGVDDFIIVDDMNFHQCMNLERFESDRLLSFNPPEGEFTGINYRITTPFKIPFTIRPMVEEKSETKIELILHERVRGDAHAARHHHLLGDTGAGCAGPGEGVSREGPSRAVDDQQGQRAEGVLPEGHLQSGEARHTVRFEGDRTHHVAQR